MTMLRHLILRLIIRIPFTVASCRGCGYTPPTYPDAVAHQYRCRRTPGGAIRLNSVPGEIGHTL